MKKNYVAVLVTGSREWKNQHAIHRVLLDVQERHMRQTECTYYVLIEGECTGADQIAASLVRCDVLKGEWSALPMPAQWEKGDRAGLARNCAMLSALSKLHDCGYVCEVHAFPLQRSVGARHMMRIAEAAGFKVFNHSQLMLLGVEHE